MDYRNQNFVDCFSGVLNILTEDRVLFQGQIVRDRDEDRKPFQPAQTSVLNANDFIIFELRCEPAIIRDNANIQTITPPLFQQGDVIRIRKTEIVAIGPGTGCIEESDSED